MTEEAVQTFTVQFHLSTGEMYACAELTKGEAKEVMDEFMCDRSNMQIITDKQTNDRIIIVKKYVVRVRCPESALLL